MLKTRHFQTTETTSLRSAFRSIFIFSFLFLLSFSSLQAQCETVDGANVTFDNGNTEITIIIDGVADMLSFASTADPVANNHSFTYVVTDGGAAGTILGIPPGNMNDFDGAGLGVCKVYGLSYTGNLTIAGGDELFNVAALSDGCFDLSSNSLKVNRVAPQATTNRLFISSNNSGMIGAYDVLADGSILTNTYDSEDVDADGIHYDAANDVLYQLNRVSNRIDIYSNGSTNPTLVGSSSSNFSNGREIAVTGNKLVVADDVAGAGNIVIYDITPTSATLSKVLTTNLELWGIHANGNQLFAVIDASNSIAVFDNIFNQPAGTTVTPDATVMIDGLVRTHGITYNPADDNMYLTDIGDAGNANDGALVRIQNWTAASADGTVSASEQIRVKGGASLLGNPVDIALDTANNMVYVAERARDMGRVLGFKNPVLSGGIAPSFKRLFAGASAVFITGVETTLDVCDFVSGGTVSLLNGDTERTIIVDGTADNIDFMTTVDAATSGYSFTYVVTDDMGMVLGIPGMGPVDFDPAGVGACNVYGLSYTGALSLAMGDNLFGGQALSDGCFDLSSNNITITRIEGSNVNAQVFASSNNSGNIGVFSILDNGELLSNSFASADIDADGIHYDEANDVLYQLNRVANRIDVYGGVNAALQAGTTPTLTASSAAGDFMNGREIAVNGNKLIVADDGANNFVIYDITTTSVTLDKVLNTNLDLWGIHLNGDQLIAVQDVSQNVLVYDDIFNQPAGFVAATSTVAVENMVRTHGLTYDAAEDYMILTDIGLAGSATDGFLVVITNWTTASADGTISTAEQGRVGGAASKLGNPVDVAYDKANRMIYVAERANGMGQILGFKKPVNAIIGGTSGIAPSFATNFMGASAVNLMTTEIILEPCAFVDGGTVAFSDGNTQTTIVVDGIADNINFTSTADPTANNHMFTYVVTNATGSILSIPAAGPVNFDGAGVGACNVYGLAYTGTLSIAVGDNLLGGQNLSDACFDLSDNSATVNRIAPQAIEANLFVSSNTQTRIGTFNVLADGTVIPGGFDISTLDADGIHYDAVNDVLYQVNRSNNTVDVYGNISTTPVLLSSSSANNFSNARGLTVSGNRLVVADDVDGANKFVMFDITPTTVTFNRILDADINLWGIHAVGERLIAIVDNSAEVAVYDNFFANVAGAVSPTLTVTIEGMVRTHGLDYDLADDMLILTDVGAGTDANDGALVVIRDFILAGADGVVTLAEQARAFGGADFLGNPVDVTLDKANKRIYVAERANGGGRILGFLLPKLSGGIAPFYNTLYAGASSVFIPEGPCDFLTGGTVTFTDGSVFQEVTVNDGNADPLSFISDVITLGNYSQTFVVTDADGMVLGLPAGNTVDFEGSGVGNCRVYSVSYTGNFTLTAGQNILTDQISDGCSVLSDNALTTIRTEPFLGGGAEFRNGVATTNAVAKLFPNPASTELSVVIEAVSSEESIINIFNAAGSIVIRQDVSLVQGQNTLTFNVADLDKGMYFVQIPGSDQVAKFVKVNR